MLNQSCHGVDMYLKNAIFVIFGKYLKCDHMFISCLHAYIFGVFCGHFGMKHGYLVCMYCVSLGNFTIMVHCT
jgi:ABC-type transporter Mla maintaining outer membrane lipid asymmetry permease subunit MlaE